MEPFFVKGKSDGPLAAANRTSEYHEKSVKVEMM